jgi:chitinase
MVGAAPIADILHPGDGETRDVGSDIPFIGGGTDAEDGQLPGGSLVWSSDLEGPIGTGENFTAQLTQVGTHTITLTVTDSDDNVGTETITLNME